eukprot:CAMPEP_0204630576 /NCGR_PEP_ID=MMETSP0717-20131115/20844_1 /ASSEMBLY_ACC=CAM_ASM_000666 /TAXON_ID=230516 /ORGANISM="Chaetoceros curvisetus" /LENGTH=470 /DNA_ID=CAMNT_0051647873 /DNA_START=5 /DNA_END=1417 /DNA_ORIENTATION=-
MKFQSAITLLALPAASAFITPSSKTFVGTGVSNNLEQTQSARLNLLPEIVGSGDIISDHAITTASALSSVDLQQFLDSTSTLLADAAEAVAETAEDDGWWSIYLQTYKSALTLVHSTIDQPLRNAGWDQTWGVSIFVFTALVRTALLPLSIQQTKSTEYIKLLKPYQDEIKEKFKDNKDMLNRATAKLFEDANANPLSGCLISILQLPILIGLYRSITLLAKDGALQEPFLFLPSLEGPVSAPDYRGLEWLTQGWSNGAPSLGWETTLAYLIMPVVLVVGQKLTMQVLTPETDKSKMSDEEKEQTERTENILKFLPLLIGYFSLQVPSGLTIYWFTSNLYTLCQSLVIRGYYAANPPEIELPDYWDALDKIDEMSPEEKRKAAEAGMAVGPKWQDILDEARYHYVIERKPIRADSPAWERAQKEDIQIPTEMLSWVSMESNGAAEMKVKSAEKEKIVEEEMSSKKEKTTA